MQKGVCYKGFLQFLSICSFESMCIQILRIFEIKLTVISQETVENDPKSVDFKTLQ